MSVRDLQGQVGADAGTIQPRRRLDGEVWLLRSANRPWRSGGPPPRRSLRIVEAVTIPSLVDRQRARTVHDPYGRQLGPKRRHQLLAESRGSRSILTVKGSPPMAPE